MTSAAVAVTAKNHHSSGVFPTGVEVTSVTICRIMSNHIHVILGRHGEEKMEKIIRDFKKFTSVRMIKEI